MSSLALDILAIPGAVCIRIPGREGVVVPFGKEDGDALLSWMEAQPPEPNPAGPKTRLRRIRVDRTDLSDLPRTLSWHLDLLF